MSKLDACTLPLSVDVSARTIRNLMVSNFKLTLS